MSDYESVRIVSGGTRWSCDRCVVDREGKLIASYLTEEDSGVGDPILRGVVKAGFGDRVWVPLASDQFSGDDFVEVVGPSYWNGLGIFALGWLGGYLAWVAIGNYQAKKMTGNLFKQNRKVPYKPMKVPASWYNFPGEKK